MRRYEAMLFDLDDTLLNRDYAVDNMFLMILEKCYPGVKHSEIMLRKFKEYDKRSYGCNDKTKVLESFFDEFPPIYRLPHNDIQDYWNRNFPNCFSIDQNTANIVNAIKMHMKIGIITNGVSQRQKAKILKTKLKDCFDIIIISEEARLSKPDKRIFELAINTLNVLPEAILFVGDDLVLDIGGCQNANLKGIWFNPHMKKNDTEIKPFAEIDSFDRLLNYIT